MPLGAKELNLREHSGKEVDFSPTLAVYSVMPYQLNLGDKRYPSFRGRLLPAQMKRKEVEKDH